MSYESRYQLMTGMSVITLCTVPARSRSKQRSSDSSRMLDGRGVVRYT